MVRITLDKPYIPIPAPVAEGLELTFDDIANVPVADASSVSDWNTFFDLPTNGTPFTSVVVDGNVVTLIGGSDISMINLFAFNSNIYKFIDKSGCILALANEAFYGSHLIEFNSPSVESFGSLVFSECGYLETVISPSINSIGNDCFAGYNALTSLEFPNITSVTTTAFFESANLSILSLPNCVTFGDEVCSKCSNLQTVNLPLLTSMGTSCFSYCDNLTTLNIGNCTDLGGSVLNNYVFFNTFGQTITLTIPSALMTCNGGNPDGDIQYLQANNTVTIVTV